MEEKQTHFLESSDSDIKTWSQMLSWKVQESQQNMLSKPLKVKKVMSRVYRDLILHELTVN